MVHILPLSTTQRVKWVELYKLMTTIMQITIHTLGTRETTYFYQLNFYLHKNQSISLSVTFENNKARIGGDDIYGAGLQSSCKMTPNRQIGSYQVQQKIFKF